MVTPRLLALDDSGAAIDFDRLRAARRDRLFEAMTAHGFDVLILGRPANVRYASGARQLWTAGARPFAPGCVVVAATRDVHVLSVWDEGIPSEIPHRNLFGLAWNPQTLVARIAAIPGVEAGARVGVDGLSPGFAELLPWELTDGTAAVHEARTVKTPEEIACIATAAAVAGAGLLAMVDALADGISERALLAVLAERVSQLGLPVIASEAVACATERAGPVAYRQVPSGRPIGRGQLVVLTPAVLYAGYEGSVGRTLVAGVPPDAQETEGAERLAGRCRAALGELVDACRAGRSGADLVASWKRSGEPLPPPAFPLAHGVGLGAEPPLVGDGFGETAELRPGMVLAVQSWVTAEGTGGFLQRDLVVVRDGAPEHLTGHA